MSSPLNITVVSESEFTVKGHGVHTAYYELTQAIRQWTDSTVAVNQWCDADITHMHTVGLYSLRHLLWGKGKKVVSAHVVPESFVGSLIGARLWLPYAERYLRWFYSKADLVLAVSEETKKELERLGVTSRIETFHNIVNTKNYQKSPADRMAARKALGIAEKEFLVVGSGQVQPRKAIDTFVRLAHELPTMRFIWVGGMPFGLVAAEHKEMKRFVDEAPQNLSFTGVIELESVRQYYHAADVFLLPSRQETFGMVVIEAAASGLPIVLRDIHDYDHTFRGSAVMCDESSFVDGLVQLRDDAAHYAAAVQKAHHIAAKYDAEAGAGRLMSLYRELLSRG